MVSLVKIMVKCFQKLNTSYIYWISESSFCHIIEETGSLILFASKE
jgi:hypothetical protein